jgi:hypothetical protein
MIDEPRARELGKAAFEQDAVVLGDARELNEGWFFPVIAKRLRIYTAVVVNKATGRTLRVMMQSPVERDPTLYDRGYQFDKYDLVVLAITDFAETVAAILAMRFLTFEPYYKFGKVWRSGRVLTEVQVQERLSSLPCIFGEAFGSRLDSGIELLEQAREAGWFEFVVLEYRGRER